MISFALLLHHVNLDCVCLACVLCAHVGGCRHLCAHKTRGWCEVSQPSQVGPSPVKQRLLTNLGTSLAANQPQQSSCLYLPQSRAVPCPAFHKCTGDVNSGLLAWTANALPHCLHLEPVTHCPSPAITDDKQGGRPSASFQAQSGS